MARKKSEQSKRSIKQVLVVPFIAIGRAASKATKPVRENKVWRKLRSTVLRSPFRGYFVDSFRELKKVTWPDRKTSWKLTGVVIVFSVIFSAFTALLDVGFEKLAKQIFLK